MKEISFENYTCEVCSIYKITSQYSLGNHLAKSHKPITTYEYILRYFYDDTIPLCACGCNKHVGWKKNKYKFAEYVNGHNYKFSSKNQPTFTKKQITNRNKSIRKAYNDRHEEITNKISISVNKALENPEMHTHLSEAQKKIWQNDEYKTKMKDVRKQVWEEQHDELYEKIFTPKMRHKISVSNMKRDLKRQSKAELLFLSYLQSNLREKVIGSYWINEQDFVKCFDAYIPEVKLLIEFDGVFWHGLDRDTNFTKTQLVNMANDFVKSKWALDNHLSLIRVKEDSAWQSTGSINELIELAYHYQNEQSEIVKDGLFKFRDDNHALIDKETLIRINEPQFNGQGREFTENELMPAIFDFLRAYVSLRGWFYPASDKESLLSVVQKIKRCKIDDSSDKINLSLNPVGNSFLKTQFKSYWDVIKGPARRFWDDKALNSVLRYRLGLNTSIPYHYILQDGTEVDCHETFDICIQSIRFGFVVQRNAVSFFRPPAAFEIYKRFIPEDCKAPAVWDPSVGFGGRLLGFISAFPNGGTYIGTDPSTELFKDLISFKQKINKDFPDVKIDLHMCGSEEIELKENSLELVMTSPPYWSKEQYIDEDTQCYARYPNYNDWFDNYLVPTFKNAYKALKSDCCMVINIDDENKKAVLSAADYCKFKFVKEYKMPLNRDHFHKKHGHHEQKTEPVLVFIK